MPFEPDNHQVIYVESQYDADANNQVRRNYEKLVWLFRQENLEFIYLPLYFKDEETEKRVKYYAPYLTSEVLEQAEFRSSMLLDYMTRPENRKNIPPSVLFYPKYEDGEWVFHGNTIDNNIVIEQLVREIVSEFSYDEDEAVLYRMGEEKNPLELDYTDRQIGNGEIKHEEVKFSLTPSTTKMAESEGNHTSFSLSDAQEESVEDLIEDLQTSAKKMLLGGISLAVIHEIINKVAPLSSLRMTDDYRIFLPEYNNIEIEMTALPKAIFFLFLNHPEGIILQRLEEYHHELKNSYRDMSGGKWTSRMETSIKNLEVYGSNELNINITRIKKAFCTKFDEHLAKNYYISGRAGEPYKIPIASKTELIYWD